MMMKKICVIALFAMLIMASTTVAWAQIWINGIITQCGTLDGTGSWVAVTSKDGLFNDTRAFVFPSNATSQMLAVALSAQAASKPVSMNVNSLESWSTCSGIFMTN